MSSGSSTVAGLKPYVESVWTLLLKHCECQEEGTRNVVAECLGRLTLIDPETLLPRLKGYLLSGTVNHPYCQSPVLSITHTVNHPYCQSPVL